ncbi:unnamed protein product [Spirodela intermedia]|uniref:Rrn7/TAF1B N-terminal cyclin domain-containing protein n=1 Tax=Spirodela intermedia TaxID=51605 RepID=A0A7I8J327_SPIIN|nr:unnamed protein product [Spirodela intermedia]CAA6664647.1 unnamed protein product [Spirodela intermedia]
MDNPNFYHDFPFAVKREAEEFQTRPRIRCEGCGGTDFESGDDGFFYCRDCGGQSQDMLETDCAEDDMFAETGALYNNKYVRHGQSQSRPLPLSQSQSQSLSQARSKAAKEEMLRSLARNLGGLGNVKEERPHGFDDEFSQPMDFGNVPFPDDKSLADGIRLRYVQGIQLMIQMQCKELVERFGMSRLICGIVGEVWFRYLALRKVFDESWADKAILEAEAAARERHGSKACVCLGQFSAKHDPNTLILGFHVLGCHIAREQILPTDLVNWATEGKLPYISAFSDIEKSLGNPGAGFPLSSRFLFRPVYTPGTWQMEATAGSIAHCVGLHLPPVNFYAIAHRYLRQLSLPLEKILQHACHIYEWSMPAELWLSANPFQLPTRVCVMSILMIAIRVLYEIHGHGVWETKKIDSVYEKGSTPAQAPQFDTMDLLCKLEAKYNDMMNTPDIVFSGMTTSYEEERLIEALWDIYEKQKAALARMRQNMKENGFEYLPPRTRRRTDDYLHYRRKKIEGRLAQVDARIMHLGVLKLERRLRWLERRIGRSLLALRRGREGASAAVVADLLLRRRDLSSVGLVEFLLSIIN